MATIAVRLANIHDIEPISVLFDAYRQFYEQAPNMVLSKNFIAERLNKRDTAILVAENDAGKLIGFCQIYPSFCSVIADKIGILYDLFVDASARNTGTGRALMLAAHEYAVNNNLARLDLTTAKNNLKAQALYESVGWARDEVFYAYSKVFK